MKEYFDPAQFKKNTKNDSYRKASSTTASPAALLLLSKPTSGHLSPLWNQRLRGRKTERTTELPRNNQDRKKKTPAIYRQPTTSSLSSAEGDKGDDRGGETLLHVYVKTT